MAEGFQRKTYVDIVEDMQARAKEVFGDNINLADSSPLGMYIQAIAWELSVAWEEMERSHYSHYAQYATGQDLDNIVNNFGRKRFLGTKAVAEIVVEGDAGAVIPAGFRVSTGDDFVFESLERHTLTGGKRTIAVKAVASGIEYNVPSNTINEIVNPTPGVDSVINPEDATGGMGIETDDDLRERHLEALKEPITGDNVAQYRVWAREVEGVGNLRVLPTTPRPGVVTLILSDVNGHPVNDEVIKGVEEHIEDVRPVSAGVVVESAVSKAINISATVRLSEGFDKADVIEEFEEAIREHFKGVALKEKYISFAQIGRLLLDTAGTFDYQDLLVNSASGSVELAENEVPELKDVTIEVI